MLNIHVLRFNPPRILKSRYVRIVEGGRHPSEVTFLGCTGDAKLVENNSPVWDGRKQPLEIVLIYTLREEGGVRDIPLDVGNNGIGVHDLVTNGGNGCVCFWHFITEVVLTLSTSQEN